MVKEQSFKLPLMNNNKDHEVAVFTLPNQYDQMDQKYGKNVYLTRIFGCTTWFFVQKSHK